MNPPHNDEERSSARRDLEEQVAAREQRKLKARREQNRSVWFGLGMFGLVGWSVAVPALLGIALGLWIDHRWPSRLSWTLMLMVGGVALGCLNAWRWVSRESREGGDELEALSPVSAADRESSGRGRGPGAPRYMTPQKAMRDKRGIHDHVDRAAARHDVRRSAGDRLLWRSVANGPLARTLGQALGSLRGKPAGPPGDCVDGTVAGAAAGRLADVWRQSGGFSGGPLRHDLCTRTPTNRWSPTCLTS